VIFWPYDEGWWGELEAILLAKIARSESSAYVPDYTSLEVETLFRSAETFKVIELSDLPLYIGWPYVTLTMARLIKGEIGRAHV
jgi:hypothetical protein